jgi:hypothetical protein
MALPQAVERAEQLANKLHAEAYGQPQSAAPEPPAPIETPAPDAAAPPEPPEQPAPPDTTEHAAPPEDSWEARYKVLTGKYNAEVPRMAAENRALKETVSGLNEKVGALAKQIEDVQSKVPVEPLIKPEEVAEFGEPLVDMARRAAREVMAQSAAPVQRQLDEVRTEVTDLRKSAAEIQWQNFVDLLTTMVPDWAQINVNNDFLTWLDGLDDLSGLPRQALLDRAKDARDAQRVARFFTGWKDNHQNAVTNARNALESHVVPDSSSRSVTPAGKQIITRAQIHAFYSDWRAGRIDDARAILTEAEINAAAAEGRVR